MDKQDYYELLGVVKSATFVEIKTAYRKKAFEFHPDRNHGNPEAEEQFKLVSEAYEILSDDQKRGIYDQFGHAGLQGYGGGFGHHFNSSDDIFSAFGDIFEDFFGMGSSGGRSRSRARRGQDLQTEISVEFLESCAGIKKEVSVTHGVLCETCNGSGAKKGTTPDTCSTCKGHGQVRMTQGFFTISTTCPHCGGKGQEIKHKCSECHGRGVVKKERKLQVKVPAGVSDGTRLLMHGEGEVGELGGPSGDLYVYIHVKEHKEFQREGDHILSQVHVSFPDLALGIELPMNTIDGQDKLKIKAGTQSGDVIQLKGKGVANVRNGRRGDHLIHIQGETPTKLSSKQKELLKELSKELGASSETTSVKKSKKKKKGIFG